MSLLNIYKASAGSGKTHRLSLEFLKYVIQDPSSFERILAVTFTNKATAEMKTRIITNLYGIAKNLSDSQNDIKDLIRELTPIDKKYSSANYIILQAQKALSMMLHNYSHFHIETIDSFFQTVLRNLEKELGLGSHLNIELNQESILTESAESLLDDIPTNPTLRVWVQQYLNSKLEENKSWNISGEIAKFGNALFTESFRKQSDRLFKFLEKENALQVYKEQLIQYSKSLQEAILNSAKRFDELNERNQFTSKNYFGGSSKGLVTYFKKIIVDGNYADGMKSTVQSFYDGDDNCLSKDPKVLAFRDEIHKILVETEKLRSESFLEILTVKVICENLYQVGLLHYLDKKVKSLNAEKNQFILSDTQALLNVMVKDDDAPFIYEKIGVFLDHIMIDEFQDTSETQWHNFKPLITECASRGNSNLVVGDPKQSIYRFRNGKWELLGKLVDEMASISPKETSLDTNWRSELNIVRFNNKVFSYLPLLYNNLGVDSEHPLLKSMQKAYEDATQLCNKREKNRGYVKVHLIGSSGDEYEEKVLHSLACEVKSFQEKGVRPNEMAILVRDNSESAKIAAYFSQFKNQPENESFCFDLISEEAYQLAASESIQCIISALRFIDSLNIRSNVKKIHDRNRLLTIVQLLHVYQKLQCRDEANLVPPNPNKLNPKQKEFIQSIEKLRLLPLYEMVEEIYRIMALEKLSKQENYYCFFLDQLNDFLVRKSSNLNLFLKFWDAKLYKMTVPSGESNGIRIMTIHKSKGLEFHTVFLPFCNWPIGFKQGPRTMLWEDTNSLPSQYSDLPFTAINCKKDLLSTHFASAYETELVETFMDNLNILYVALTRAEKNMVIIGQRQLKTAQSISHLLEELFMTNTSIFPEESDHYQLWRNLEDIERVTEKEGCLDYELGEFQIILDDDKSASDNPFKKSPEKECFTCVTYKQKAKFRQSNKSNDFIEDISEDSSNMKYIDRGKLLHYIFSKIASYDDVDRVLNQMEFEGIIQSEEKPNLLVSFKKAMHTEEGQKWFKPGLTLYNECSILFRNEKGEVDTRRPDRVIREGNHMTVIDFKFGKSSDEYQDQLDEYVNLLTKMGYETQGFIWYLNDIFS